MISSIQNNSKTGVIYYSLIICFLLLSACGIEKEKVEESKHELPEIPLAINFATLSEPVKEQINQRIEYISLVKKNAKNKEESKLGWAIGQLGKVFHAYDLMEEARDSYLNAIFHEPNNYQWYYLLAYVYKGLGDLKESKKYFEKVLTLNEYVPAKVWLSDIFLQQNDFEAAQKLCREILLEEQNHPRALYILSLIKQHYNEDEKALEYLLTILPNQPQAHQLNYQLGQVYARLGNIELAKKHNDRVVEDLKSRVNLLFKDPLIQNIAGLRKDYLTLMNKARSASAKGRFKNALTYLDKILETKPDHVAALYQSAVNYYKLNNIRQAKLNIQKTLEFDPNNDKVYALLTTININENNLDIALKNVKKALHINPENLYYLNLLADVYYRSGDFSKAADYFKESLEINADQSQVKLLYIRSLLQDKTNSNRVMQYISSVSLAEESRKVIENIVIRISLIKSSHSIDGELEKLDLNSLMSLETIAMVLANKGDFKKALAYQNKALEIAKTVNLKRRKNNVFRIKKRLKLYQSSKVQDNIWLPFEPLEFIKFDKEFDEL